MQDSARIEKGPAKIKEGPPRIEKGPARIKEGPAWITEGPARIKEGPARIKEGPTDRAFVFYLGVTHGYLADVKVVKRLHAVQPQLVAAGHSDGCLHGVRPVAVTLDLVVKGNGQGIDQHENTNLEKKSRSS